MTKYTLEGAVNYAAECITVGELIHFEALNNLVGIPWRGYVALVSKDIKPGTRMVMFPPESQLSEAVAYEHNLYSNASKNKDTTVKGYFGNTRRVKAIRLRGVPSNAFAADASWFDNPPVGTVFDTVDGVTISRKYTTHKPQSQTKRKSGKQRVQFFPEHYDTGMYLRNPGWIVGGDYVTITQKIHGTSGRWGRVPVLRELTWKERLAKRFGVPVNEYEHQFVSGSRHVIKGISEGQQDFYDADIWSEVGETIKDRIPNDVMVYGEIIGWIGDQPIQKDYTYRIPKGEWRMYVYRVSVLSSNGTEYDLPWPAVEEFCENRQLETVKVLASGTFYDMRKRFDTDEAFAEFWMDRHFYEEGYDALPLSDDSPVDEGVVIRADNGITPTALKIKGPMFYEHESASIDQGVPDIEEEQN